MPKPEITYTDYLVLIGLAAMAQRHNAAVYDLIDAAGEIVGDLRGETGHVADVCWSLRTPPSPEDAVAKMLRCLNIPVPRRPAAGGGQ